MIKMKTISLTQGQVALVDDEDFEELNNFTWHAHRRKGYTFYAVRWVAGGQGSRIKMHQQILRMPYVDHKDGDGLNNQRSNLRGCNHSQNLMNQRAQAGRSSQYKGVYHYRTNRAHPWAAYITVNKRRIYLGYHSTEKDAARAYNAKAVELFGEFARLNEVSHGRAMRQV